EPLHPTRPGSLCLAVRSYLRRVVEDGRLSRRFVVEASYSECSEGSRQYVACVSVCQREGHPHFRPAPLPFHLGEASPWTAPRVGSGRHITRGLDDCHYGRLQRRFARGSALSQPGDDWLTHTV